MATNEDKPQPPQATDVGAGGQKDQRQGTGGKWIVRWRDTVSVAPELPGVWRRRDGGFHVRARVIDPRTGKMREVNRELPDIANARAALVWLQAELEKVRAGNANAADAPTPVPQFHAFARGVFARKNELGKIKSAAGRMKWNGILANHLIPEFGDVYLDQLRPTDVKAWQSKIAAVIKRGDMAPTTANTILAVLQQITDEAVDDFDIRDPMRGVDPFDTREHSTYTEEEPNSLAPDMVPHFLAAMRERHPEHYAFTFLGITTGLRPSTLRPLRREGPQADIKWADGLLVIRRSHTVGAEVMETTKTDLHQRLALPRDMIDVLRWHVDNMLLPTKMRMSDLLFPSITGGFRSRSCLDRPFDAVSAAIKLPFNFTPRGMRRTYQDLARALGIHDAVTRAISGHATVEMQMRYSTARSGEVRDALARMTGAASGANVISLDDVRRRRLRKAKSATAPTATANENNSPAAATADQPETHNAHSGGGRSGGQPENRSPKCGAGEGIRTLDVNIGKVALYH